LAENDSIELLTISGHQNVASLLGSKPRHFPNLFGGK
jgi:hypothetical protein